MPIGRGVPAEVGAEDNFRRSDGMGGLGDMLLQVEFAPVAEAQSSDDVDVLSREPEGTVTILGLGPLANLKARHWNRSTEDSCDAYLPCSFHRPLCWALRKGSDCKKPARRC